MEDIKFFRQFKMTTDLVRAVEDALQRGTGLILLSENGIRQLSSSEVVGVAEKVNAKIMEGLKDLEIILPSRK